MGYSEPRQTEQELKEESRKIRRLQLMMNLVMSTISQTEVSLEEASQMVADARTAALTMFPDKELAYDIIYKPRLQRLMRERFRLQ
jgi:DNA helicase IV